MIVLCIVINLMIIKITMNNHNDNHNDRMGNILFLFFSIVSGEYSKCTQTKPNQFWHLQCYYSQHLRKKLSSPLINHNHTNAYTRILLICVYIYMLYAVYIQICNLYIYTVYARIIFQYRSHHFPGDEFLHFSLFVATLGL